MESKKRKRETSEPPRVTYDAATRTFDRLFKEDSLDAMKTVVRKKLGLSGSTPVFLSQWREGKAVDLEDDEDFEAFSAATRSSTSVVVKVILGENQTQTLPLAKENETPSTRRKRRKKSKREGSTSPPVSEEPSEENVIPDIPSEPVPSKKRRVSFAADAPDLRQILEEKSKKKDKVLTQEKSASPPGDTTEPEQSEKEGEPVKKKKKSKKNKNKQVKDLEEENKEPTEGQPASGKEGEKKKTTPDSAASTATSVDATPNAATATEFVESTSQPKKSKKRLRIGTDAQDEATFTVQPALVASTDEGERLAKKSKKKKNAETAGSDTVITDVTVDTTTTAKPTLEAQAPTQSFTDIATEEPKKKRKKKHKAATDLEDNVVSEMVNPGLPSKNPDDMASSEKPKKSTKSKTANTASDDVAVEPTRTVESAPPALNNIAASSVLIADESEKAPAAKESKKKKEKNDYVKSTETSSEPKDVPFQLDNTAQVKSKKSQDTGKDSESPVVAVAKDNVDSSEASNVKALKKGGKQKKNGVDTTEQTGTTEGQSMEQANATQSAAMKEATRLAVLNVLKKAAEKAASSPASGQFNSAQPPPASTESSSVNKASLRMVPASPLAARSTEIQPPTKVPSSSEGSKGVDKPRVSLAKSAKESNTCPICETSPFHARTRCPVIKSGIRAMRKKIAELEQESSEEGADSRASIILELQGIIERRTKKSRVSDVHKPAAPEAESESPGKESEVAATETIPSPAPAPAPSSKSSAEVEAAPTSVVLPASAPTNSKIPLSQPISARAILSQKSTQPTSSQKASSSAECSKPALPRPTHIAEAALGMDLLGFGDMSQFTDKDLDALIRGPRLSVKNALTTFETEDESDQEEDVVLEEDVAIEGKSTRNASRVEYPSSSDEPEEDEEEEVLADAPMEVDHLPTAAIIEEADVDGDAEKSKGNLSFQEINALGSSVELDRTGDSAVYAAVGADLASINEPELSQSNGAKDSNEDSDDTDSGVPSPTEPEGPVKVVEDVDVDPIEPSDPPPATQPPPIDDLISSDDEDVPLVESTPKSESVGRTRSQRTTVTKKAPAKASQLQASQSKVTASKEAAVDEAPKPRTRGMKKLTELPVPPNPAVRVIRQATVATPRTRRQLAQEKEREETPEEPEVTGRTRRAAAAAAKVKTPAKAPPKTPAKTPARAKTTAKPLSKQGKTAAVNGFSADQGHEATHVPLSSPGKKAPGASWAVLQESIPSQVDTDNGGQVDELLSSPTIQPQTSPLDHGGKGEKSMSVNGSQQDPLFIPAESQQSFPYSQYPPDIAPTSQAIASPNDSDDENEVALAVVKTSSAPQKQAYRSLTDIASQSKLFAPRPSQILKQVTEPQDEDLFGQKGQESEESDSGSDSDDDDNKRVPSHIPAARRAGVAVPKKK